MLNADPPLRRRGCQLPLSMIQITTAALYLALTALVFVAIALCASSQAQAFLYPVHGALVALTVLCYVACSCLDVTLPGGVPCVCMASSQASQHWDRQSGGIIPGFDHYCVFLGAAVGRSTYFFFYILAAAGLAQFSWQVASMAAVAAGPWLGAPGQASTLSQPSKQAFAGVVSFLGLAGVVSFGPLCFFHTCVSPRHFFALRVCVEGPQCWQRLQQASQPPSLSLPTTCTRAPARARLCLPRAAHHSGGLAPGGRAVGHFSRL
jgi:hypothetical protein